MPCEAYPCVWMALLGGCRLHGNMGLGEACVRVVMCYVICTAIGKWDFNKIVEKKAWNRCEKQLGWCLFATCVNLSCALTFLCLHVTTLVALSIRG